MVWWNASVIVAPGVSKEFRWQIIGAGNAGIRAKIAQIEVVASLPVDSSP